MVKKRKVGRPTTLTAKAEAELLKRVSCGSTVSAACRALKIRYATVGERRVSDPIFRSSLARACLQGAEACIDEAEDKLRKAKPRNIAIVRELAHHMRWKASKLLPQYRDQDDQGPEGLTGRLPEWIEKPFAQWNQQDRIDFARREAFTLHRLAHRMRKDFALSRLAGQIDLLMTQFFAAMVIWRPGMQEIEPKLLPAVIERVVNQAQDAQAEERSAAEFQADLKP